MSDDLDDSEQLEGDRQTVASLIAAGDPLTKARQVDHWIYFPTAAARDRFLGEVFPLGFSLDDAHDEGDPPLPSLARVMRVDQVDLASIHAVVMTLFTAAQRHGGDYDGWECPVEVD